MKESGDIVMGIREGHFSSQRIRGELGEVACGRAESRRNASDADSLRKIAIARRDAGDASDLDVELATVSAGQQANAAAADSLTLVSTLLDLQTVIGGSTAEATIALVDSLVAPSDSIGARAGQPLPIAAAEAALRSASLAVRLQRRNLFAATSITTGFALTGSSTPPICAAAEIWTRFPICAQLPTNACESIIVPSST